jgi:hypothetical protein
MDMNKLIDLLENIQKECFNREVDVIRLDQLMKKTGKKYLDQFSGEMKSANMLALGTLLCGDAAPYDFAVLSERMIENSKNSSIKNYFVILLEELKGEDNV